MPLYLKYPTFINLTDLGGVRDKFQIEYYHKIIYSLFPYLKNIIKYTKPFYNPNTIFDAKKIYKRQIIECQKKLRLLVKEKIAISSKSIKCNKNEDWLYELIIENKEEEINNIRKEIRKLEFKLLPPEELEQIKSFDIYEIKKIPIESIMPKKDNSIAYLCPAHNEKTPSFYIIKKTNKAHCFGCGFHGSVIDVYMALNNCDFVTACKELSKY
jgi:hypothetical protein